MDLLSQHEAFLRAIFDAPDDDTPRLVYADFLEENGEPERAALIRAQCELARQRSVESGAPPLREFPRGFRTPWKTVALLKDQLANALSFRRHTVAECPECFAVEGLKLCGGRINSAELFDVIFSLSAFARVSELNLEGQLVEHEDAPDVISYSVEPTVTTAGVVALARHRGMRRMTSLILTNNDLDNDAARALVRSPYLDNLKTLRLLDGNRLRGRVWQQVIERFGEDVVG
jgi:uncharacterized protein (TIGR02996 family)